MTVLPPSGRRSSGRTSSSWATSSSRTTSSRTVTVQCHKKQIENVVCSTINCVQCCTDKANDYLRRGELFLALVLLLSGDLERAVFLAGDPLLLALGGGG